MGVSVTGLSEMMSEREILYHLDDLSKEPPMFDVLNELFARLNKNIVNCSDFPAEVKRRINKDDYKLKFDITKEKSKQDLIVFARKKKYEGMIL